MIRILLIDTVHPIFVERLSSAGFEVIDGTGWSREKILAGINSFQGIEIRSRILIDKEFINKATALRFIARAGAGMESIDVTAAAEKNIACLNSPEGNRNAVAEHAMGMLLSLMNRINKADREIRQGKWIREENRGIELRGKTVALIGYGNTGSSFAACLKGFGVKTLVYDRFKKNFSDVMVSESTMEEIYKEADILSLHIPLRQDTTFLVNDGFINRFKKNIFLLNTSRGKIVKTDDLVKNIQSGKILGAGLDVNEYEDTSFESVKSDNDATPESMKYLFQSDKVVLTPHIAGWTQESLVKIAEVLAEKIISGFRE